MHKYDTNGVHYIVNISFLPVKCTDLKKSFQHNLTKKNKISIVPVMHF